MKVRGARRFREQKWLLDSVVATIGLDWDLLRMATVTAPIGFEGMGDWAVVASKAKRFDDISPSFEEVAAGREARAHEAEREGNEVTARESYLVASIYYGVAQWPIDEINDRNLALNAKKLDCYARYAVRAHHRIERVEIPMGKHILPAWLHFPVSGKPPYPLVIMLPGMDTFKEKLVWSYGRQRLAPGERTRRSQEVQRAVADAAAANRNSDHSGDYSGWLGAIGDEVLTALLAYGYPALGLTLLLCAIGLPLPGGLAATVAGSLAAQGRMNWIWAAAVIVAASVVGDAMAYALGRLLGRQILERHGRWFGYTPARHLRAQRLFEHWGSLTVFVTRTFVSHLSSVASLLAGMSRYPLGKYLPVTIVGRVVWTAAYLDSAT